MSLIPAELSSFELPTPTEEHRQLRDMLVEFVRDEVEPQAEEHNQTETFNWPLFRRMGELGLFGVTVPEEAGGTGMDSTAACLVCEELSFADAGLGLAWLAHTLLFVNNLYFNGNEDQRSRYLPRAISGEWLAGMCMTEPAAGTDVPGGLACKAVRQGDVYLLNGEKTLITNGSRDEQTPGDVFIVYALTGTGLSSFIVESRFAGFSVGQRFHGKLGMRSSATASLVFEDCRVPVENILGAEGESPQHMMRNLEIERLGLAAQSLGMARRSLRAMTTYAMQRRAFGQPINRFGQVQFHIAESYAEYRAARAYVYDVARQLVLGEMGHRLDCDGAKLFAAHMAKRVADRAIQVLGGYGYFGEYVVERMWRDAKLIEIGGGTVEAHQKNITKDLTKALERDPQGRFL
jgi:isovaleryl-CoA dehydrogenase